MKKAHFLIIIIVAYFYSCKNDTKNQLSKQILFSYPETVIPKDPTKLWVDEGDNEKDTVLIICQGGPKDSMDFIERGKSSWRYLPNYENYYKIHLHQSTTLNTDIFRYKDSLTMDMARKEVDNSTEILDRAITYFKNKGKTVYVMGHSYGAFIIPHYLATRKSMADKYVIVSGRIDDPKHVVDIHKKGFNGTYKDGVTFISDEGEDFSDYNEAAIKYYTGKQLLKAASGEISYSKALKGVDLKNSIYVYCAKDERVGGLTKKEFDFLKLKGFQVYETEKEHGYTIYGFVDGIKEGKLKF